MYVVVVYDIIETAGNFREKRKNRTRLYKKLKGFGSPVQYSVFEFNLTPSQREKLIEVINNYIEETDRVSIYTLCEECRKRIERLFTKPREEPIFDEISSIEV